MVEFVLSVRLDCSVAHASGSFENRLPHPDTGRDGSFGRGYRSLFVIGEWMGFVACVGAQRFVRLFAQHTLPVASGLVAGLD